ncbi:tRNA selenocysteine 1-associated protein 1-like [Anneissia japonica]|uniref:tRNA selenocysteine 1-associated protein 1-like n=1 Tax=Anneissia japonica TaxID=1529436 RepID=UPI001425553B|nr:tRNA selenocysteine 1-associated protein 1-like [Anneissia japonica]
MSKPTNSSSIYMANLDYGMDEQFVRGLFEGYGEKVVYVRVIRKTRPEGSSYAYCFVDFGNKETATRVLRQYNNQPIPGMPNKRFRLNHCQGRGDAQSSLRPEFSIFVGDLSPEVDDLMLHDFFAERYKDVKGAKVVLDDQGIPKGFGFVRFFNEDERNKASVEMQGSTGLGSKPLKISVATPKSRAYEHNRQQANYYGNNQYGQQYNPGQWNQQWQQQGGGGDYGNQYYGQGGGEGEWSAMNYEQYYSYQAQGDMSNQMTDQANAGTEQAAEEQTDKDDQLLLEHGQAATDMETLDEEFMKQNSGELYRAMQKSRWHPVDTYLVTMS